MAELVVNADMKAAKSTMPVVDIVQAMVVDFLVEKIAVDRSLSDMDIVVNTAG